MSGHRSLSTCQGPRPPRAVPVPAGRGQRLHSDNRWVTHVGGRVHTCQQRQPGSWAPGGLGAHGHPGESPHVCGSTRSQGLSFWEGTSAGSTLPRPRLPCPNLLLSPPKTFYCKPSFIRLGTSSLVTVSRRSGSGPAGAEAALPGLSRVETDTRREEREARPEGEGPGKLKCVRDPGVPFL